MHDIEPYYKWREYYVASEDERSPFYGRTYDEFMFTKKIYNYFIHPQWDYIGSQTLYIKILYVDYNQGYTIIELIGEWNDAIYNDVMYLKREIADRMISTGINKFVLLCDNVLNFHSDDDCYYEEWYDDVKEDDGWICLVNLRDHIFLEMEKMRLEQYVHMEDEFADLEWRRHLPDALFKLVSVNLDLHDA